MKTESSSDLKYEDPLFARMQKGGKRSVEGRARNRGRWGIWAIFLFMAAVGFLTYFLFENEKKIDRLHSNLSESRGQLERVTVQLEDSGKKIVELGEGLTRSQSQLKSQRSQLKQQRGLYNQVKSEQEQQTRELRAMAVQKADRSRVDSLQKEAASIREDLKGVDQQVAQAHSAISGLRATATRNRTDIGATRNVLDKVRQSAEGTAGELSEFKRSFQREHYNFELYKKGGFMKVFGIHLKLRGTDYRKQRCDLEVFVDGKRIKKDDQHINEPVYFYTQGQKKPFEIVLTKVNKEYVVGYLSVPKS